MSEFERKLLPNGKQNPKYIDLCDEDEPIAGQKFTCISFVSPEKILKKREMYLFNTFVKQWDFTKSMMKFNDFLQFVSYKYSLNNENLVADFQEYVKEEDTKLKSEDVEDDYKTFLDMNEDKLNEKFNREHSFQTSVRGIKIRGSFSSQEEAENWCTELRKVDPNHDIFVGKVGVWMPWDPDAYKTGRIEFMEEELNQLHQEKIKNEMKAKQEFEARVNETKRKAIEENIKMAEKSGNKLGVKETINFEEREAADTDTTKIRNELLKESFERSENNKE